MLTMQQKFNLAAIYNLCHSICFIGKALGLNRIIIQNIHSRVLI